MVATPQLSDTVGAVQVMFVIEQLVDAVFVTMFAGQVIVGGVMSLTVTVNEQVLVLLLVSIAVHVTVFVPLLNVEPLAGEQ